MDPEHPETEKTEETPHERVSIKEGPQRSSVNGEPQELSETVNIIEAPEYIQETPQRKSESDSKKETLVNIKKGPQEQSKSVSKKDKRGDGAKEERTKPKKETIKPEGKQKKIRKKSKSSKASVQSVSEGRGPRADVDEQMDQDYHRTSRVRQTKIMDFERHSSASKRRHTSKSLTIQDKVESLISIVSDVSLDEDVVTLTVPETAQKIVHCLVGKDLFVDKTWCMVQKKHLLEDIAVEDTNSPFFPLTQKILDYKADELLIGYEPFASEPNQFMLCVTESGRDDVLTKLEEMKSMYLRRIQQSKAIEAKEWESLGSEDFVNQFQVKNTRKLISLEWIGDITKRCFTEPKFEDCDPDDMKNGYTCLVPSDKEKFELIFRKTQEAGIQAVASKVEAEVQTEPEIPTNASTQYAPETEISVPDSTITQAAMKSEDLDAFFKKYLDYLLECLEYNEVYDLYHDDYPALYVEGEETQVQQLGTYHQYQSFTDVAAIEGKLVVSSSWHPNYTGIVALAYANEIPCLMKDLEFDSDQTDYEEEKTDEEGEGEEEPELGAGAREWLEDERKERESSGENTELFDRAVRRLKDIESAKIIWDAKIQEESDETRKTTEEAQEDNMFANLLHYKEYKEPEPEPEPEPEEEPGNPEESPTSQVSEGQKEVYEEGVEEEKEKGEEEGEMLELLGAEGEISHKSSKMSYREQLEADIEEIKEYPLETEPVSVTEVSKIESGSLGRFTSHSTLAHPTESQHKSLSYTQSKSTIGSFTSAHKAAHHHKKHKRNTLTKQPSKYKDGESVASMSSLVSSSMESRVIDSSKDTRGTYLETEFFDEVTDDEEIKEKQDELPLLEVNNPVLIWSFVDDLTPKLRLDSPYEVRVVEFNNHNGNIIAGGTSSGQVVLWDITGRIEELEKPESLTQNQQMFRKRMENLMSWRRDIRSKRRVRFTAISNQKESHLEKITNLVWISPNTVVTEKMEILKNPSDYTIQLATSSIYGSFHIWDVKSEPAKGDYRKAPMIFKTKERFGRPDSLDMGLSPYHKLHRIWKPLVKIMVHNKNLPVPLTGFSSHKIPVKHIRVTPKLSGVKELLEDRIEYKAVYAEPEHIPYSMYICNLFGQAGTAVWNSAENPENLQNIISVYHYWDSYHDRPITRIAKHPFIPSLCLTVGGHVFAVWHVGNTEDPILVKRYYGGVYVTDGSWSMLRPSLIRIARSDGVVEIWDLIIQNHAPATTIIVSGRVITNVSPPLLPEVRGLLGVADYNSAFCLFYIPQQFRVWTEQELSRLTQFINREPERKKKMKEWSKWWRENNVNVDREERKQAEEKMKMEEEVRLEKEKQEEARKKYNEEVYKWYMRRRGKSFLWSEEADEKWREKQEEHMHEMVMAKKKIDRSEMEILMRPIVREEKNEALKHLKAEERLKQADNIFRQTVELIFPKSSKVVEAHSEQEENLSEQCLKFVQYYFHNFEKLADEQVKDFIERNPWQIEFEWFELLEKYNALRMLFNDRRRLRSKTLKWLRKKLREELLKEGRKVHVRRSHMSRYPKRKIKRRQEHLEELKEVYGDDYNIYWDKHQPCRRFSDRKFRYAVEDIDSTFLGELSEPDVEDEELPQIFDDGKVMGSLEMITEMGIEHIPEETFAADLDIALLTLESRTSLGVKKIPSLFERKTSKSSVKPSSITDTLETTQTITTTLEHEEEPGVYLTIPGMQSPQDDSDVSFEIEITEEKPSMVAETQIQELDYIQQPVGTKINTLQIKRTQTVQKREISHGVKVKFEESVSDDFDFDGDRSTLTEFEMSEGKSDEFQEKGSKDEDEEEKQEGDEEEKEEGAEKEKEEGYEEDKEEGDEKEKEEKLLEESAVDDEEILEDTATD